MTNINLMLDLNTAGWLRALAFIDGRYDRFTIDEIAEGCQMTRDDAEASVIKLHRLGEVSLEMVNGKLVAATLIPEEK